MHDTISSLADTSSVLYKGRADLFAIADIIRMENDTIDLEAIRVRLQEALDKTGKSMRAVSISAGVGSGYLHSILKDKKEPGVSRLAAVSEELGVSMSYILHGIEMSPGTEKIISRLQNNLEKEEGILKILGD